MGIHRHFSASCDDCGTEFTETHEVWLGHIGTARTELGVSKYSEDLKAVLRDCYWQVNNGIVCPTCQITRTLDKVQKELVSIAQKQSTQKNQGEQQ